MLRIHDLARRLLLAGAVLSVAPSLLTGCSPNVVAATDAALATHRITVAGRGEAAARPDIARVQVGIEVMAPTVAEATQTANTRMAALMDALKGAGVAEKDIRTSNFSINFERTPEPYGMPGYPPGPYMQPMAPAPEMAPPPAPPPPAAKPKAGAKPKAQAAPAAGQQSAASDLAPGPAPQVPATAASPPAAMPGAMPMPMPMPRAATPTGFYRVSNTVEVAVRDLTRVGSVLDTAVAAGANNVWGVNFGLEHPEALEAEARKKAVADARARAEALAKLNGVTLGELVAIREQSSGGGMPGPMPQMMAARDAGSGTSISPGEVNLTMFVEVVYALPSDDED